MIIVSHILMDGECLPALIWIVENPDITEFKKVN